MARQRLRSAVTKLQLTHFYALNGCGSTMGVPPELTERAGSIFGPGPVSCLQTLAVANVSGEATSTQLRPKNCISWARCAPMEIQVQRLLLVVDKAPSRATANAKARVETMMMEAKKVEKATE